MAYSMVFAVRTRAEELHLFTNDHRAYATCDSVVIVVEVRAHQVIVLILQRRGVDGDFSGEFLEVQRQFSDHRTVMFGSGDGPMVYRVFRKRKLFW